MQDTGKVAATLGVTFAVGVITGWLLNSYTRKVRARRGASGSLFSPTPQPSPNPLSSPPPPPQTNITKGLEGMLDKLSNKVKRI
jgi:hypothetical protein